MEVDYIGVAISIGGEERTAGVGWGGDRKVVSGFAFPGLRPFRVLTTKAPAPGRGPRGRGGMVFVDGEGVPSYALTLSIIISSLE